ncbi:BLUF domain-containing protein [Sulfitobacter aestuarii]|uniref:BLUF domain-containing protein n=1 Tax=Sulfitobacter aestuarii TaxID=2161676 RepID=A0ABW5U6V0_9RHOB
MHFLIYTSTSRHLMAQSALASLLEQSRLRNAADEVTGMLLYKGGSFMQVLEGEKGVIFATFARIGADARHKDVTLLRDRKIEARSFAGWSMGFRAVDDSDLAGRPGYAELGGALFDGAALVERPHVALKLLRSFHRNTR